MSVFRLEIELDKETIEETDELPNILRRVAGKVARGLMYGHLLDTNGNRVGDFQIEDDDDAEAVKVAMEPSAAATE